MAVEWKIEHKRGSEYLFYPDEIIVRAEDNGRHDVAKIDGLIYSFSQLGQLQPVSIVNEGGAPVLKAGFSRWRAAMAINEGKPREQQMRLRCVLNRGTALETTVMNVHENVYRNPTTALDDAYNIARLMDRFGKTREEIAEVYRQPLVWVKKRLRLLKLGTDAQAALANGDLKPTAAQKIAELAPTEQRAALTDRAELTRSKPTRKAQVAAARLVADSPAYPKAVREFAGKWVQFLAGEIEAHEL